MQLDNIFIFFQKKAESTVLFVLVSLTLLVFSYSALAVKYTTDQDIIVVADPHGAYSEFVTTLKQAKVVDDNLDWMAGKKHFVSLGDLMGRGPASRKIMDLLIKLQAQAEEAGGKLHVILGNHEVMNLTGDLRYASKEEFAEFAEEETLEMRDAYFEKHLVLFGEENETRESFDEKFAPGYFARLEAFKPDGDYGKWLLSLPYIIQINQQVFVHAGLSPKTNDMSLDEINEELREELSNYLELWDELQQEYAQLPPSLDFGERFYVANMLKKTRALKQFLRFEESFLVSLRSPVWYRGNITCHPLFEADVLDKSLKNLDAKSLWVGHTVLRNVSQRFNHRLIMMDTGMLPGVYYGRPTYAILSSGLNEPENWQFFEGKTGDKISLSTVPTRRTINPHGMSDEEVENFLSTADITSIETLGEGITNPKKVRLEKDGKTIDAIFKYFDSKFDSPSSGDKLFDRYQYEVATYKLDRMMGLDVVPVAVERRVDGDKGALVLWLDGLISYNKMQEEDIKYDGFCHYNIQRNMMNVFDYLIRNDDRNLGNITFTESDWQLWFIDHTRAFGNQTRRPKMLRKADLNITPEFREKLESLNKENLKLLNDWLTREQIRAILKRRDRLLNGKA